MPLSPENFGPAAPDFGRQGPLWVLRLEANCSRLQLLAVIMLNAVSRSALLVLQLLVGLGIRSLGPHSLQKSFQAYSIEILGP